MTTPLNERRIANAIRVLAMDAVQCRQTQGIQVLQWGWQILLMSSGASFKSQPK